MSVWRRLFGPSKAALALQVLHLEGQLAESKQREAYWQKRAELFIDRASAQAGLTHEPVMQEKTAAEFFSTVPALAGAGMMEFDSTKVV